LADFNKWLACAVVGDSHDIEALVLIATSQYWYVQHVLVSRPQGQPEPHFPSKLSFAIPNLPVLSKAGSLERAPCPLERAMVVGIGFGTTPKTPGQDHQ